ncbi:acyl-CoA carboxylase epsilon subunit [Streptomyces sp. WM6386]|uniref:acyl-CoA carboxylase epsilon subunit n=1 Tax=Streptomyces sp. WM6386 TaxID=1415558 RepID=UPI000A5C2883|nr:acyl-CoA carboxylase epsilon subunit [Streptomyces sp. WM6386]
MESGQALLRVERGNPGDAELAALAVVVLARCASERHPDGELPEPGFRQWREPSAYAAPDSWR